MKPFLGLCDDRRMVDFAPLTAGSIIEPATAVTADLAALGYLEEEFSAAGLARCFDRAGAAQGEKASFRTRVVVRRPVDPARFSGTLIVEWLNVSSGFDADPDWAYLH